MLSFVRGQTDILLATTIMESGLDIPRANTIFIDKADGYGLPAPAGGLWVAPRGHGRPAQLQKPLAAARG